MMAQKQQQPNVILVRHGHSEGNAGKRTANFMDIPLEEHGHKQARLVADDIINLYGVDGVRHIVTTPYLRTQQTAEPLVNRTGLNPVIWPDWREITYLQPSSANEKTHQERAALRDIFWTATGLDPDYRGEGELELDSANSFLQRMRASLGELSVLAADSDGLVVVYTHEFPISAAINFARGKSSQEIISDMVRFQKPSPRIDNTQAIGLTLQEGQLVLAQDSHIDLFPDSRHQR